MPALDQILTALARSGHWGCVGEVRDSYAGLTATRWTRTTEHAVQTLDVHWTAHTPPRLHHAWLTSARPGLGGGTVRDIRFGDVATLTRALIEDKL